MYNFLNRIDLYFKNMKMDYRKFYEEQTKKKVPKNFEIHHIDENRNNNSIENLVAIPFDLHQKIHLWVTNDNIDLSFSNRIDIEILNLSYEILKWETICNELIEWLYFREYLLWKVNIKIFDKKY